jgi:hypothetical protein
MKTIKRISIDLALFHIESEPGDATHYSYIMLQNYDKYIFMPFDSTFRFPQKLDYYDIKNLSEEEIIALAKKENCNPFTLSECIRTIEELHDQKTKGEHM